MPRPHVIVHMTATVDGRITLAQGRSSTEEAWKSLIGLSVTGLDHMIRELFKPQAILEGSGSFLSGQKEPSLPLSPFEGDPSTLYKDFLPGEVLERPGHKGWFVVPDSRGLIRWTYKEHEGWHLLILAARRTPPEYLAFLRQQRILYLIAGRERVDLALALELMYEKLGIERVLCQGGGRLNGALLRAGLIDEVNIVVIPALVGGEETPTIFDAPELAPGEPPVRLKLMSVHAQADGNVWLRYEVMSKGGLLR